MKTLYSWVDCLGYPCSIVQCDEGPHHCLHVKEDSKYPPNCSGWHEPKYEDVSDSGLVLHLIETIKDLERKLQDKEKQ